MQRGDHGFLFAQESLLLTPIRVVLAAVTAGIVLFAGVLAHGASAERLASDAAGTAGEANETVGVTPDKVTIGSCIAQTGKLQMRGQLVSEGAACYFSYINEQGGINGRKIDFVRCDDAFDPEKAIACFNSCLKGKVFAQAFCIGSPGIIKYVRMSDLHGMPLLGILNGTTAAYEHRRNVFILRPSYAEEAEQQVKQLWDVQHLHKIALVFESDAFGSSVREALIDSLHKRHAELIKDVSYSRAAIDLPDALATARSVKPDALIIAANSGVMPEIIKLRKEQNWHELCLTLSSLDDALSNAGGAAENMIVTQVAPRFDEHLASASLYLKLHKKYYPNSEAHQGGFEAFLNAIVLVEGLKRSGHDLTRTNFIKALGSIHNFDIGAGDAFKVNFSPNNHQGWPASSIYFGMIRQGKLVPMTASDWTQLVKQSKQ